MRPVTPRLRLILEVFAGLALIAGALLFLGATNTEMWWSWTIAPPLTAATLGAFYWAAFLLILIAARSQTWARARPAVYPVAVIAVLLLVCSGSSPTPSSRCCSDWRSPTSSVRPARIGEGPSGCRPCSGAR
jgi:hypothetical protein